MKEHESDVDVCENQQLLVPENFDDPVPEVTALVSDWVEEEVETPTVNDEDTSMIRANFSVQETGAITVLNAENCNQFTESSMAADQTPCSSDAGNNTPSYDEATTTSSQFPSTTATPLISPVVGPKPVKVKSRWRRTSELEQVTRNGGNGGPGSDQGSSCNNSPSQSQSVSSSPKQTAFSCSVPLEELTSATDN